MWVKTPIFLFLVFLSVSRLNGEDATPVDIPSNDPQEALGSDAELASREE